MSSLIMHSCSSSLPVLRCVSHLVEIISLNYTSLKKNTISLRDIMYSLNP